MITRAPGPAPIFQHAVRSPERSGKLPRRQRNGVDDADQSQDGNIQAAFLDEAKTVVQTALDRFEDRIRHDPGRRLKKYSVGRQTHLICINLTFPCGP